MSRLFIIGISIYCIVIGLVAAQAFGRPLTDAEVQLLDLQSELQEIRRAQEKQLELQQELMQRQKRQYEDESHRLFRLQQQRESDETFRRLRQR